MKTKIVLLLLAVCIAAGCTPSLAEAPALLEPAGVELDYAAVQVMDLYTVTPYTGGVIPYTEDLSFSVDGAVETVHVSLGSTVKAGDALITLDEEALIEEAEELEQNLEYMRRINANAVESARIDIQIAQLRLDEMKKNGASDAEIIRAQSGIDMMELKLRQSMEEQQIGIAGMEKELAALREKIGQNVLTAPYDGVIVSIASLREESAVAAYDPVIRIADESRIKISCEYISQNTIKTAHEIYALVGGEKYALEYIPMDMDEYLSAIFSDAPLTTEFGFVQEPSELSCGEFAVVCVVTGYVPDALVIPCNALYIDSAGRYVYKLGEDGQRSRVSVHTGSTNSLYFQITEGLEEGDLVYVKE